VNKQIDGTRPATTTRGRLVDAAAAALNEGGLSAATTKEIARRAGVTEPTLYLHFASKTDLIREVLRERLTLPVLVAEIPADAASRPVADVIAELLRSVLAAHRALLPILASALGDPSLLQHLRADPPMSGRFEGVNRVAEYLAGEQRSGRLGSATPPQILAREIFGAAFHHAVLSALFGEDMLDLRGDAFVLGVAGAVVAAAGVPSS